MNFEECFFTNLFLGLRKDMKMIGKNPGLLNNEDTYLNASIYFFKQQIELIQPRVVIILGKVPYNFICDKMGRYDLRIHTFKSYFEEQKKLNYANISLLCIPHPSMWNTNVKDLNLVNDFLKLNGV